MVRIPRSLPSSLLLAVVLALAGLLPSACFVAPEGDSTCARIGALGGTLQLEAVLVEVPPNALPVEQMLCASLLPDVTPPGIPALTQVVELTPIETTFQRPVRLSLRPLVDVTGRSVSLYESRDGVRYTASNAVADGDIISSILAFGRFVGGDTINSGPFVPTQPPPDVGPVHCDATNCNGCCIDGICLPGTSSANCGEAGAACSACSAPDTCFQHACQNPFDASAPIDCGPHNCNGCCVGDICLPGTSLSNCGSYGQACSVCEQPNLCHSGTCQPVSDAGAACSAANCNGCCQSGICLPGTSLGSCGSGGNTCTTCPPQYVCDGTFCVR